MNIGRREGGRGRDRRWRWEETRRGKGECAVSCNPAWRIALQGKRRPRRLQVFVKARVFAGDLRSYKLAFTWQCFAEQDEEARLTTENTTSVTAAGGQGVVVLAECVPPTVTSHPHRCDHCVRLLCNVLASWCTVTGSLLRDTKWYDGGAASAEPLPRHPSEQLFCLSRGAPSLTEELTGDTTHQGAWCPIQLCLRHERRQQVGGGGTMPAHRPLTE
ncbi:hypothetical protein E2C01_016943 [Portunus trituberculatus]|uniref:Uncharacterized protein n=1 Tax=Portunus trituberculatus TaxID=210409 RepID=A0A5B7DRK3_PORTR|nr:hypothetical protein [Portunus trituberculatus]